MLVGSVGGAVKAVAEVKRIHEIRKNKGQAFRDFSDELGQGDLKVCRAARDRFRTGNGRKNLHEM